MCLNLSEDMQQGLNARDQAVFDDQLAALPQVWAEEQAAEASNMDVWLLSCHFSTQSS
jgi:hypothetical protein